MKMVTTSTQSTHFVEAFIGYQDINATIKGMNEQNVCKWFGNIHIDANFSKLALFSKKSIVVNFDHISNRLKYSQSLFNLKFPRKSRN